MTRDVSIGTILGLNNRLPLTRMEMTLSNRSKAAWLRVADNIDLESGGLVRRRQGFSLPLAAGAWRSLWSDALGAYGVAGGDLVHIDQATLAPTVAVAGVGFARISYARLPDGMVYWSNGTRIGRIDGTDARDIITPKPNPAPIATATSGGLPPGRYQVCFTAIGPDGESASTEPVQIALPSGGGIAFAGLAANTIVYATGPDGEIFNEVTGGDYLSLSNDGTQLEALMLGTMPAGHSIAHYRGSLLVARGNWLYVSQPYRYGLYDTTSGAIPFPKPVSIVQPCEDGVYVCADKTYWIPGDPLATTPVVLLPHGALPGSSAFDPESQTAYWQGKQGAVVAKPGGAIAAPQDAALTFKKAESGFTWVREQDGEKHLITTRFGVST